MGLALQKLGIPFKILEKSRYNGCDGVTFLPYRLLCLLAAAQRLAFYCVLVSVFWLGLFLLPFTRPIWAHKLMFCCVAHLLG